MLTLTGDYGRSVIEKVYPSLESPIATAALEEFQQYAQSQTLLHKGRPRAIQGLDERVLLALSSAAGGIVEVVSSCGDFVVEGTVLLRVYGGAQKIDEKAFGKAFEMGEERTFEQDPKLAIRLLVDIAIKALSPAINDPTTAVQALDQIEDLLRRLGYRRLEIGAIRDSAGKLRLLIPHPSWEDFLVLAFEEIRLYGANSMQVMRRMNALVSDLIFALPAERHKPLLQYQQRLGATIVRSWNDTEDRPGGFSRRPTGIGRFAETSLIALLTDLLFGTSTVPVDDVDEGPGILA
jgi:uncharacterized membrane protein